MQWSVTSPPANPILTTDQLSYALRLDPDIAATGDEQSLVADYLAAATEYAQNAMSTSILTQTITAVFFNGDKLVLPRGPVQSITSVAVGVSPFTTAITNYTLQRRGNTDVLKVPNGWVEPLTVVYVAGYGTSATNCPADIRQAIRTHVGSMYENRESIADKAMTAVPQSLADFYARKNRSSNVG